jgi:hypothetical protein
MPLTTIEARIVSILIDGRWHPADEIGVVLSNEGVTERALATGMVARTIEALRVLGYGIAESDSAYRLYADHAAGVL